jgi:hypothetical protein
MPPLPVPPRLVRESRGRYAPASQAVCVTYRTAQQ